jgi:hypothetical protein
LATIACSFATPHPQQLSRVNSGGFPFPQSIPCSSEIRLRYMPDFYVQHIPNIIGKPFHYPLNSTPKNRIPRSPFFGVRQFFAACFGGGSHDKPDSLSAPAAVISGVRWLATALSLPRKRGNRTSPKLASASQVAGTVDR